MLGSVKILVRHAIPVLLLAAMCWLLNLMAIDPLIVNRDLLWDTMGRPLEVVLREMNLARELKAVLVAGTADSPRQYEDFYGNYESGFAFVNQLQAWKLGTLVTPTSMAELINSCFAVFAFLFALVVAKFAFNNLYISLPILLLLSIFRNFSPGFIYGIPHKYAVGVFSPLIAGIACCFLISTLKSKNLRFWHIIALVMCGFLSGLVEHMRQSELMILKYSLLVFMAAILAVCIWKTSKKTYLIRAFVILLSMGAGLYGYRQMVEEFQSHRDKALKIGSQPNTQLRTSAHPIFHSLFVSLFRFPNEFKADYTDETGFRWIEAKYPEYAEKYQLNYINFAQDITYYDKIREEFLKFVAERPGYVTCHLAKSVFDYLLFLPYYTWSGDNSVYAYLPKLRDDKVVQAEDQPFSFRNTSKEWILNLKWKYLPRSPLFWIYMCFAYCLLILAIYWCVSEIRVSARAKTFEILDPIVLVLFALLTYFFFASAVRILIPNFGQSAVVAFNLIAILSFARLMVLTLRPTMLKFVFIACLVLAGALGFLNREINSRVKIYVTQADATVADVLARGRHIGMIKVHGPPPFATGLVSIPVPVKPGREHTLTLRYARDTGSGAIVVLETFDKLQIAQSATLSSESDRFHSNVVPGSIFTHKFTPTSDLVMLKLYSTGDPPHSVYFSDIRITGGKKTIFDLNKAIGNSSFDLIRTKNL